MVGRHVQIRPAESSAALRTVSNLTEYEISNLRPKEYLGSLYVVSVLELLRLRTIQPMVLKIGALITFSEIFTFSWS